MWGFILKANTQMEKTTNHWVKKDIQEDCHTQFKMLKHKIEITLRATSRVTVSTE